MRIGLIDVDGHNYPNLVLMKLSAHHKLMGDEVEWYTPWGDRYDIVYKSKVFSFTPHCDHEYIKLSRWVNNRFVFFKVGRYEDYKKQQ